MGNIHELLQRIDKKKQLLDNLRPLPPELVINLNEWFAIDYTYNSNAIEGNTLSPSETAIVIEKGITIGGKTIREHLEAINHAQAIEFIRSLSQKKRADLALDDILAIHKIILSKIDDRNAGVFRTVNARITGSPTAFPNSGKVPFFMVDFMQWLHTTHEHPIINAALAHFKLVTIHPFVDGLSSEALAKEGNGRTSRLLMNVLLLQTGYPLAVIKNQNRNAYIDALETARATENYDFFYTLVAQAVEESLDIYLKAIIHDDE